jgi:peroxiredoxin
VNFNPYRCHWSLLFLVVAFSILRPPAWAAASSNENTESVQLVTRANLDSFTRTNAAANVFIFFSVDCPICNKYVPELDRLIEKFKQEQIRFCIVYPDDTTSTEQIKKHALEYRLAGEKVSDPEHLLVAQSGATTTPEAVVYAEGGKMIYRGRIDDRFPTLAAQKPVPTQKDLESTLQKVVEGKRLTLLETRTVGCRITSLR